MPVYIDFCSAHSTRASTDSGKAVGLACAIADSMFAVWNDQMSQSCRGTENAMESAEVNTRCRREGCNFGEEILRFEDHGGSSVPPRTFQPIQQPPIG